MIVTDKLSTESFHAFIDEQLTDEQYAQVEAQLDELPEKIEEIQQCHIINERLREVFDPIVEEPVPDDLLALAVYGLEETQLETENEFNYQPGPYTELEEDLAAIDSLDIFSDTEHDEENYIDDATATDLELLAQTEHLSEFDIDNLRNDSSNIIPDIFDDSDDREASGYDDAIDSQLMMDPTDDLLESIDTLSLEIEKAHQNKMERSEVTEESHVPAESDDSLAYPESDSDTDNLELEPFDMQASADLNNQSFDQFEFDNQEEQSQFSQTDQVLETLSPEEEFTLEPLEEHSNEAFIQESEIDAAVESFQNSDDTIKQGRPRNIRADQRVPDAMPITPAESAVTSPAGNEIESPYQPNTRLKNDIETESEDGGLPDDLVAEFFAPNKGPDFELNEVVKHFEEVSGNFPETTDDHLYDDGPFASIKFRALDFMDRVTAGVNDFKADLIGKKNALLDKLYGGQSSTDFNKSPFANFSATQIPQPSSSIDALDLSAFEDAARESSDNTSDYSDDLSIREEKNDFFTTQNEKQLSDVAPDAFADSSESLSQQDTIAGNEFLDYNNYNDKPGKEKPGVTPVVKNETLSPETDIGMMDFGLDDDAPDSSNLVSKFGDTLKFYKQKIAEMRANALDTGDWETSNEVSTFAKYKNIGSDFVNRIKLKSNLNAVFAAVVVAVLFLGVLIFAFVSGTGDVITSNRVDKLAIDAHILNTQFNSKIVPDADSAIIEKLQWFSARVGRKIRLADIKVEDFEFKKVSVMPTMASFAATNIFENKAGQRITLVVIPDIEGLIESPLSCRIPSDVDGLCVWVKDSVRYVAVANLSLSRVRSFSEQIIGNI